MSFGLEGITGGAFSLAAAKQQRDFIKNMRRTAYQDTMEDMRKAGLNPILAYRQGPTTSGQATQAMTPKFGTDMFGPMAQKSQAASAKGLREKEGLRADAQAGLANHSAEGVRLENIITKVRSDWAQTEAGRMAIHGKMVGGGPIGAAAAAAMEVFQSNKGPSKTGPPDIYKLLPRGAK